MVALTSRFSLLSITTALVAISQYPINADAVVVGPRHSTESTMASDATRGEFSKSPDIPLPSRVESSSAKEAHDGGYRQGKAREESQYPNIHTTQSSMVSPDLQRRQDGDCPDKVIVNGDRHDVHLQCRHHQNSYRGRNEVVRNGDHEHIQREIVARSPRHSRPAYQRRADSGPTSPPRGVPGIVEVVGSNSTTGQDNSYGEFIIKQLGAGYDVEVSSTNRTTFYMVDAPSDANSIPSSGSQVPIVLQAVIPDRSAQYCCTYDPNPSGPKPMNMDVCSSATINNHSSQIFMFDPAVGVLQPMWFGKSSATSPSNNQTASGPPKDKNVRLVWKPLPQDGDIRVASTPSRSGQTTQTVTVTVTVNSTSPTSSGDASGLRGAIGTMYSQSPWFSTSWPSSSTQGAWSKPSFHPSPSRTLSNMASTTPTENASLRVEVSPEQSSIGDYHSQTKYSSPSSTLGSSTGTSNPAPTWTMSSAAQPNTDPNAMSGDFKISVNLPGRDGDDWSR